MFCLYFGTSNTRAVRVRIQDTSKRVGCCRCIKILNIRSISCIITGHSLCAGLPRIAPWISRHIHVHRNSLRDTSIQLELKTLINSRVKCILRIIQCSMINYPVITLIQIPIRPTPNGCSIRFDPHADTRHTLDLDGHDFS